MKFVGRISTMGDKMIIVVPKEKHQIAKKHLKKQIKIVIDDI